MRTFDNPMKIIAIAAVAAALSPAAAFAAHDWTGPYAGGNVGMGTSSGRIEDKDCFDCVNDSFTERLFQFGVHGGYNSQINGLVLGGEGELTYGTQHHTGVMGLDDGPNAMNDDSTLTWTFAALARMGVVVDDAMFYLGAGPALSHISGASYAANGTFMYRQSYWQPALKAALGLEFFVTPKMSVRLQYSSLMVSDRTAYISGSNASIGGKSDRLDWLNSQQVGTVGLDWHF